MTNYLWVFFVFYPGGRDEEMSVDYLLYYMMNPSPDTMAIFLPQKPLRNKRRNRILGGIFFMQSRFRHPAAAFGAVI